MNANQPGLFDLPDRELPAPPERSQRGRNRETWARTATADVTIIDAEALCEAAALAKEGAVTVELVAGPDVEDAQTERPAAQAVNEAFDALAWLIWPTDGFEGAIEAGAFRIVSMDSEVVAGSGNRGTLTWAVTVKLVDVDALRRLASQAYPEEARMIEERLAVAWQHAADPFAPLRSIAGVAWRPGQVDVQHLPRRRRDGD
jgi:hypothetical protein